MTDAKNNGRPNRPAPGDSAVPAQWPAAGPETAFRVLAVCQASPLEERLLRAARALEFDIHFARTFPGALQALRDRFHDVIVLATADGGTGVREFVREARALNEEAVVVIAAPGCEYERLMGALVEGAYDFLLEDADESQLRLMLGRAADHARLRRRSDRIERVLDAQTRTLRQRVEELAILNELSRDMSSVPDLAEVLRRALRRILAALDSECGSFLILDPESGDLVVRAAAGTGAELLIGHRRRLGEGVSGKVAQQGNPVLVTDIARDSRFKSDAVNGSGVRQYQSPSFLAVPLVHHGVLLGELNIAEKRSGEPFTPDDLRFVSTLAGHVSSAVDGALAAEELRRANDSLRENVCSVHERLELATEKLAHAESIAQSIVRTLPAAIAAFDLDLRVTFANDAARELLGLVPGQMLRGQTASTDLAALANAALESVESGQPRRLRCRAIIAGTPSTQPLDVVVAPIRPPDGRVRGGTIVAVPGRCPLIRLREPEENKP